MNSREKSDRCVVPKKLSNKGRGAPRSAEAVEGRDLAKGNSKQQNRFQTQCRADLQRELHRVREAAQRDIYHPYPSQGLIVGPKAGAP